MKSRSMESFNILQKILQVLIRQWVYFFTRCPLVTAAQFLYPVSSLGNCTRHSHILTKKKKKKIHQFTFKNTISSKEINSGFLHPQHINANLNFCQFQYFNRKKNGNILIVLLCCYFKRKRDNLRCYCRDGFSLADLVAGFTEEIISLYFHHYKWNYLCCLLKHSQF